MRAWGWVVQYGIAIFLALVLGAILGGIPLFKETTLGATGLTASDLVQFLGYGGALLLLWLLAYRATTELPEARKELLFLRRVIVPLATLIVVSVGYKVLGLLVGPFLDETSTTLYNWVFVLGIVGAALWLALVGYRHSALLIESFAALGQPGQPAPPQASFPCPQCGATAAIGTKFCSQCGQSLALAVCQNCNTPLMPGQRFCRSCGTAVG